MALRASGGSEASFGFFGFRFWFDVADRLDHLVAQILDPTRDSFAAPQPPIFLDRNHDDAQASVLRDAYRRAGMATISIRWDALLAKSGGRTVAVRLGGHSLKLPDIQTRTMFA